MHLHKEAFGAIVQTNVESVTENFENIGAVVSSLLIELPALVELILKLEAFKDITQHIVSTVTESHLSLKCLKHVSLRLAHQLC